MNMQERPFSGFAELSAYLDQLGLFRMKPGFERVQTMMRRLGLDRPPFAVVQIVGTNGKGSSATMLAALGRAHGLRTGIHRSPHLVSVRERVQVNDAMLAEEDWLALANALIAGGGGDLSYFEFVTCLGMLAFAEKKVELAVMETGLGGRFDATTALHADMLAFTPIALDHQAVLGPTLKDIAADKAGAMRPGKPAWTAPQSAEVRKELERVARERQVRLYEAEPPFSSHPSPAVPLLRLGGEHQQGNARLALAVWRALVDEALLPASALSAVKRIREERGARTVEATALANAWLPGRMQRVAPGPASPAFAGGYAPCPLGWPPLLLDGAHNCHGLAALGLSLGKAGLAPAAVIFSCLADKSPQDMIPHLRALATGPIFVPPVPHNPRAMPASELAALIGLNASPADSLRKALELAAHAMATRLPEAFSDAGSRHPLLICGSLYLLGEFYEMRPDCLTPPPADFHIDPT